MQCPLSTHLKCLIHMAYNIVIHFSSATFASANTFIHYSSQHIITKTQMPGLILAGSGFTHAFKTN